MIALALALPLAFLAAPAASLEYQVPRNEGWVTDQAGLLSADEESSLEARLEEWKKRTGHQIAVLTIPTLGGESLEEASLAVARAWGIGSGERSDGALLFVAQQDRGMRIEVGNGLEGALTDSISGRIMRDVIAPKFRSGQFGNGIRLGVESMIGVVDGGVEAVPALQGRGRSRGAAAGLAFAMFIVMLIVGAIMVNARRLGRRGGWGSTGPFFPGRGGLGGFGGFRTSSGGGGGGFSGFGGGGFSGGGASGSW